MKSYGVSCGVTIQMKATEHTVYYAVTIVLSFNRGGSRGRVQGVRPRGGGCGGAPPPPPPPPETICGFLIQLVFCKKKTMWFIGVEVEQETSALALLKKILDPPLF